VDDTVNWTETEVDPISAHCQENYVLIITEGASTADINETVMNFAIANGDGDTDIGECTDGLKGSTYFDDLTWFGYNAPAGTLYPVPQILTTDGAWVDKQNITTNLVIAGGGQGDLTNECSPDKLMLDASVNGSGTEPIYANNPVELENRLLELFNALRLRASAGSAASVISSARGGEGAIYQAIFWPELAKSNGSEIIKVAWAGDVHGLFLDNFGFMYEDTNRNRTMDSDDRRVVIFYDEGTERSMACLYDDPDGVCTEIKELDQVNFLWAASEWLSDYPFRDPDNTDTLNLLTTATNRTLANYISNQRQRYIFTWNDQNKNGIVDTGEVRNFQSSEDWTSMAVDFDLPDDPTVDTLINWLRGADSAGLRPRYTVYDDNGAARGITWRLGDIIHSTPMTVAAPAEGYHLIYNDYSYAQFVDQYKRRRHVVYFGANDGMLHAVNAGFYSEMEKKFCMVPLLDEGVCPADDGTANAPALGAELWAYVPHNLQPHLNCLTDPAYKHKYFVDQRPRIFDAQIFPSDDDHPNGWGTILVGALRFGGAPINAADLQGADPADTRRFVSSYFILDITNPEKPPVLLGELTQAPDSADLGYSTVIPSMVIMKDDGDPLTFADDINKWYLVFGSGPHGERALKGISDQTARIGILPLDQLVSGAIPLRFPASPPTENNAGIIELPDSPNGYASDLITVDFDINPSYREYKADAVYFGTVETTNIPFGFALYNDDSTYWDGGGHMYRLVMEPGGHIMGRTDEPVTTPDQWEIKTLLDLSGAAPNSRKQPITAAASVGTDKKYNMQSNYNFWIYFGTGRFFDPDDKTDIEQQSYYGIKEPMEMDFITNTLKLTWDEVELSGTPTNDRGDKGLMKVDEILVIPSNDNLVPDLYCRDNATGAPISGDYSCMTQFTTSPDEAFFKKLEDFIAGTGTCSGSDDTDPNYKNNCVDGWYLDFWPYENRERNVGQATLLGGLVTFTTYQPFSDVCKAEGNAYLYGVYYRTGTAWRQSVFGTDGIDDAGSIVSKLDLGKGLATTPNLHVGATGDDSLKAFVQTSTGEIKEITQENLPVKSFKSGRARWKEYIRD